MAMAKRVFQLASVLAFVATTTSAAPVSLGLGSIEQIELTVTDIPRAEAFYEGKLGLRKLLAQHNLLIFDAGGQRLLLGIAENGAAPSRGTTIFFRCAGLAVCITTLKNQGIEFIAEPERVVRTPTSDLWLAFFRDPDGNSLALLSEAPNGYDPVRKKNVD